MRERVLVGDTLNVPRSDGDIDTVIDTLHEVERVSVAAELGEVVVEGAIDINVGVGNELTDSVGVGAVEINVGVG